MNFDYYLFDLDNSLLFIPDPSEYFDDVLVKSIELLSLKEIPKRDERNQFWLSGEKYIEILKEWGISDLNIFWKHFDEIDFEKRKILVERKEMFLFNDVLAVLKKLSQNNKKIALISNAADYIVKFILRQFNISHLFHEILGLGFNKDQGIAKPSPRGILNVLNKLNYNPSKSRAIMIGDSFIDILAAKRAKIKACLIKRDQLKYTDGFKDWEH